MSTASEGIGIRSVGGLLPSEFLFRLRDPKGGVGGVSEIDYHLAANERLGEIITRSWSRLVGAWSSFSGSLRDLEGSSDMAGSLTRDRWLGPLFNELGFGRLASAKGIEIAGQAYPISNEWQKVPVHLVGAKVPLDRRSPGVRGAAGMSPHAMVQEILNRSEERLWGLVSNGLILRVLRDSTSLTRQSYLEFDLEVIFTNERFDDFVTLWMVCHQSRFEGEDVTRCWLERWRAEINQSGVRALDALQGGVKQAIESLGRGFLAHPENRVLRESLRCQDLTGAEYYREILRLVYRILFLFVAEDRQLMHSSSASLDATERYQKWYSTVRLRRQAWGIRSNQHDDLWQMLSVVMSGLGRSEGIPELGLTALGSFLWSDEAVANLSKCRIVNSFFGEAIVHLSTTQSEGVRRSVDFANLGAEELGSVYEALLELYPEIDVDSAGFDLHSTAGNERKTSGSYYTPSELVASLIETALDPVLAEAARAKNPEQAILSLKVFDPACGSGHFLIAAAHRIAQRVAAIRTGESEAPPPEIRHALREVISRCCYGVDINPMAVELAKVSLWMEAMEPGKPLTFLERHIVVGNALLGTTPALVEAGVPDEAFKYIDGDSKPTIAAAKALNKKIRVQGLQTLDFASPADKATRLAEEVELLEAMPEDDLESVEKKAALWEGIKARSELERAKLAADIWCSAFVNEKQPGAAELTTETVKRALVKGRSGVAVRELECVDRLTKQYGFLHLHVAFPEVFRIDGDEMRNKALGWSGGFDVVLGNPPWEQVQLKEEEFFAVSSPRIAKAKGARRKELIKALEQSDPVLFAEYRFALRTKQGESAFLRASGRFLLTGQGRINTYAVFAELMRSALSPKGRCGIIVPTGIATDDSTSDFFGDLTKQQSLVSLYDFENRLGIFPAVDNRQKFCLLTLTGAARPAVAGAEFVFFAHEMADLGEKDRRVGLSASELELFNPNTRTTPIFRTQRDAEMAKQVYEKVPVLIKEVLPEMNLWGVKFQQGLFNMTSDSALFRTRPRCEEIGAKLEGNVFVEASGKRWLPLYEAKLIHHFDHRFATYEGASGDDPIAVRSEKKGDPAFAALPRNWVAESEVKEKLENWDRQWLLGFRGIARSTDERTVIASVLPAFAVGNNLPLVLAHGARGCHAGALLACITSFALDAIARTKVGGSNLNFFILKQFPILPPEVFDDRVPWSEKPPETLASWISQRVLELTYTANDLAAWAAELSYVGTPFGYDESRRMQLRAELDACFFHLYGFSKAQVEYAMESFPIVKRHDEERFGEFRTKRLILDMYDRYR